MSQEKLPVTKNTSCDKRSLISVTEGFFPVKERIVSVTGIKEHLVLQYNFPVNEGIILVTENKFPVTRNIFFHRRNLSMVLKNSWV